MGRSTFPVDQYQEYDLILVDESHNFRNTTANRYDNLMLVATRGKPKKLIFMTATPVNNSLFDLHNQIKLLVRGKDDALQNAGIKSLTGYFVKAQEGKEHLYDLLEEIAVRRSRNFIKKSYPNAIIDGKPIKFPERRLHTVQYSLEKSYSGLYQEIATVIENLNLASYNVEHYRKDVYQESSDWSGIREILLKRGWEEKKVHDFLMRLGRGTALVHIMKTLYLKRLESSVESLKISIERQMKFQERFLEFLKQGKLLDSASYRRIFVWNGTDEQTEEEQSVDELIQALPTIDPKLYEQGVIEQVVQKDVNELRKINDKLQKLTASEDSKLRALKEKLLSLRGKKVVIFTYFKDTARYIYKQLRQDDEFMRILGKKTIRVIDSEVKPKERKDIIHHFSPVSNDKPELKGSSDEIDILISTDVLSEGQNLQDGDTLINYDLHWNPVRMIQRAGRIDRIGSPHDMIDIYNFFPEDALEVLLGLLQRLWEKLEYINRSVGLDTSLFGEMINPQDFNALRRIKEEDSTVVDELESLSELDVGEFLQQELLDFLKRVGEEKVKRIPLGVGSGMKRQGQRGLFVYLKGYGRHFWCYHDLNTGSIEERELEIVKLIRCSEDTPREEINFDVYEIIEKIKDHIVTRFEKISVMPPRLVAPQNHVMNFLQSYPKRREIKGLIDYFSEPLPSPLLKSLNRIWQSYKSNHNIEELIKSLNNFVEGNPRAETPTIELDKPLTKEDLMLVCYEALM